MATTRTSKVVKLPDADWINPAENPERANAEIAALLAETTRADIPIIEPPEDDLVHLPGGLVKGGKVHRTAVVKELTGEDEEALARASQSLNPYHFIDRLLKCGVVQIGDLPEHQTEAHLKDLLVGDREQLILGIRRATYGEEVEVPDWRCSSCGNVATLTMELDDIPSVSLSNPLEEISFDVSLRKGGVARVRLATGEDHTAIYENKEITQAQRETILLSRCVMKITQPSGMEQNVAGYPSIVRNMSVPDRHKILRELRNRQPGPKYDDIHYTCEACGEEVTVVVGIGNLFLDFGWL